MTESERFPTTVDEDWFGRGGLTVPASGVPAPPQQVLPLGSDTGRGAPDWLKILDALLNSDDASVDPEGIKVTPSVLWGLEAVEQELLGLPPVAEDLRFRAAASGMPGKPGFRIELEVFVGDNPLPLAAARRRGPFVRLDQGLRRVPGRLLPVIEEVDRGRRSGILQSDLLHVAVVRTRSLEASVELDSFLEREEIEPPDGLTIEADFVGPDEVRIRPVLAGVKEEPPGLGEDPAKRVYTSATRRKRHRVVLTDEQRSAIDELGVDRVIRGPEVARFQENPEAFLPEEFDLSRFSPRVKGVIPYRYRSQPYLSVSRDQTRDWFHVESGANLVPDQDVFAPPRRGGGDGVFGEGPPEPSDAGRPVGDADAVEAPPGFDQDRFRELCRQVVETGEEYVLHNGNWILISLAEARSFLEATGKLIRGDDGRFGATTDGWQYVLDVATNLEVLEYAVEDPDEGDTPTIELGPPVPPEYPPPALFHGKLRPYQLQGYRWLRELYEKGWGGLLADDMGLGKTIQVIALLAHIKELGELAPVLLVVPKTLMTNWERELNQFCPSISRIYTHQGPDRSREEVFLANCEVVLVTYQTLRIDQKLLATIDWSVVVCDEAQYVKNPSARVTSAVKAMKGRARVALTGTPVENGLSELWCIADFIQAGRLGTGREFRDLMERPLTDLSADDEAHQAALQLLHERLGPHYMRRTKEELRDELPQKEDVSYPVGLGARQSHIYERLRHQVVSGETIPIAGLQKLIQACSHPELIETSRQPLDLLVEECPKLSQTIDLLQEIQGKREKVLIFTRYRLMQDILQRVLEHEFGVYASILNGAVDGGKRQPLVDRFQRRPGFGALILAPEAAGVGLNITGANHVIHYSRLWNPAKERQATDRVYRIKQTRPVFVHYPIVTGEGWKTVEEHLDELLREKSALAENVIVPSNRLDVGAELGRRMQEPA